MEDDRVAILETQLTQAKLIAEEADKKYEEVRLRAFFFFFANPNFPFQSCSADLQAETRRNLPNK